MGLNTLPCTVDVAIACWPWGAYLGDDAVTKGVRMKICSWTRHDHNTMPPASKTTGNYVNSSLAKVEALKAGYDEAIMLNPQGFVSECTGENIFVARHGMLITPPLVGRRARGHHPELGHDDRPRPRLRGRASTTSPAATSTSPRRCSCAAPRPRSRAVNSVDDRAIPCPGPMTTAIADGVRARPSAARSTATRTGSNMSTLSRPTADAVRARRRSRSSTPRCATAPSSRASRSPSTTSCASPSSSTGSASHWIEGG